MGWLTLAPTPTAASFSFVPPRPPGWTASTWSSARSLKAWMSSKRLNPMDLNLANVLRRLLLRTVVNYKEKKNELNESKKLEEKEGIFPKIRETPRISPIFLYQKNSHFFIIFFSLFYIIVIESYSHKHTPKNIIGST